MITQKQERKTTSLPYARFILNANKPILYSNWTLIKKVWK